MTQKVISFTWQDAQKWRDTRDAILDEEGYTGTDEDGNPISRQKAFKRHIRNYLNRKTRRYLRQQQVAGLPDLGDAGIIDDE